MTDKENSFSEQENASRLPSLNDVLVQCQQPKPLADGQPSADDLDEIGCCYFGRYYSGKWRWEYCWPGSHSRGQLAVTHYLPGDVDALPVCTLPPQSLVVA